jgi:hypothetical protein
VRWKNAELRRITRVKMTRTFIQRDLKSNALARHNCLILYSKGSVIIKERVREVERQTGNLTGIHIVKKYRTN